MFWFALKFCFYFRLQYPKKATEVLEADFHQKLIMKFNIKDSQSGQLVGAHQTFVKLTNQETKQEIIFIAEADTSLNNKFDLVRTIELYCLSSFG